MNECISMQLDPLVLSASKDLAGMEFLLPAMIDQPVI